MQLFPKGIQKLGIKSWADLAFYFPIRYVDESNITALDNLDTINSRHCQVEIMSKKIIFRPRRMLIVNVCDSSGFATLRFIYFRQSFVNAMKVGKKIRIIGQPRDTNNGFEFIHPKIKENWLNKNELSNQPLLPVYPTLKGVSQLLIRRWVLKSISQFPPQEWLHDSILKKLDLPNLKHAVSIIHQPPSDAAKSGLLSELTSRTGPCWKRIKFDELLAQQVALNYSREVSLRKLAPKLLDQKKLAKKVIKNLPFELTDSQKKVCNQVFEDLKRSIPCNRLIQGDVGCGKTVIAGLAVACTVGSNKQAAIMAPTELLAKQLYIQLKNWLEPYGVRTIFFTGNLSIKDKKNIILNLQDGEIDVVVGTQALIQDGIVFKNLGLSVIDEQHRFGVSQRIALRKEGVHLLGMSATPIPRSLAMTFLADLDFSTIDELPKNRKEVETRLVSSSRRNEICERIKIFIKEGGQVFWVCPMIDEPKDAHRALSALKATEEWLRPIFNSDLVVVHGKQSKIEKNNSMESFTNGTSKILLATTVIEVGIDVPNAGLIVIENAERFGLAQLHQLRGRVGRGNNSAMCVLMFNNQLTEIAKERMKILYSTSNGFEVAKKDLELRGPGEILGIKQSGEPGLKYSNLIEDSELVDNAIKYGTEFGHILSTSTESLETNIFKKSLRSLLIRWSHDSSIYFLGS